MAPCLEIFRASATDLYRAEGAKSVQPVVDILNKTEGHIAYVPATSSIIHAIVLTSVIVLTVVPNRKIPTIDGL